eukprot:scaffold282583_cov17-Prasinocladus_malaysianus.AAC.1
MNRSAMVFVVWWGTSASPTVVAHTRTSSRYGTNFPRANTVRVRVLRRWRRKRGNVIPAINP